MEFVKSIKGVDFINDSKATNIDSTMWALNNLTRPIILIAGGKDKNSDYTLISNLIQRKVKKIIVIGQARDKIKKIFSGVVPIEEKNSLEEAVGASFSQAIPGDCVLLSPMCASFDMFDNYEHRGNCFKEIVGRLN